jgi:hypothetical protein
VKSLFSGSGNLPASQSGGSLLSSRGHLRYNLCLRDREEGGSGGVLSLRKEQGEYRNSHLNFSLFVMVMSPYPDIFSPPTPPYVSGISGQILHNLRQRIMKLVYFWREGVRGEKIVPVLLKGFDARRVLRVLVFSVILPSDVES